MSDTAEIDAIVAQTEASTNHDIPMESNTPEAQPEPQTPQEYEFESEGRKYKGDISKLTRWAQLGVNAPNKIGELSKKIQDYESKLKSYEPYDKTYKPIDEWAKANPDKWQALFQSWQQAQYGAGPAQGEQMRQQLPPEVIQKLQEHDQWIKESREEKVTLKNREADQSLDGEIGSIRKQFSNLDFDAPDETGNSLEYRILEHATKNGIPSFRAAFRDYCFDQLNQFSESKGRESGAKGMPPKTKAGLLGKDPAPARGQARINHENLTMDQLHRMALAEIGAG